VKGIPFVDLGARVAALRGELEAAIGRVLGSGWFILGPEGEAFERELAAAGLALVARFDERGGTPLPGIWYGIFDRS